GLPYWKHWHYLEHWFNPAGTVVHPDDLRQVESEREARVSHDPDGPIVAAGEQLRKRRTVLAEDLGSWKDFYDGRKVRFAAFIPPGRYSVRHPWKNEFWRIERLETATLRDVISP